ADASPPKWHLGHTSWFFEEFLLKQPELSALVAPYEPSDSRWGYLFNSYYEAVGARHPRPQRGLLTRPAIGELLAWRQRVSAALERLLERLDGFEPQQAAAPLALVELGLQHEQQHQELLLMDLLDGFSRNPLEPSYSLASDGPENRFESNARVGTEPGQASAWLDHPGGLVAIGHPLGEVGPDPAFGSFHFDNEGPRHRVWLEPFAIARQLVSNGAYGAFIADGGYRRPELWMSEGWAVANQRGWQAPRYWRGDWEFTLAGRRPRHPEAPVRHLSWFEADAFARWAGARLPSEAEWEITAQELDQAQGLLWQWTASPYRPYPGFVIADGAVGEYNGKFMTSQFVLRGSSFLTPAGHERLTYRNFFPPSSRWMAAGLRLARGGEPQ
ncbi:MAG: ergothioneine biosynthesis protein EgtB, partial [Synechococcus sp. ELA619]